MAKDLSKRLLAIVDALPLRPGMRVLEIGCGLVQWPVRSRGGLAAGTFSPLTDPPK